MPEHFYLLITEPEVGDPSVVTKVIKERFSKQVHAAEENARKAHSFPQNALCARVGPQPPILRLEAVNRYANLVPPDVLRAVAIFFCSQSVWLLSKSTNSR